MSPEQTRADARPVDDDLVRRLVAGQFPQWAGLAPRRWPSGGTVNAMYRLAAVIDFGCMGVGTRPATCSRRGTCCPPMRGCSSARLWVWTTRPGRGVVGGRSRDARHVIRAVLDDV
jgi:hypothetical protein